MGRKGFPVSCGEELLCFRRRDVRSGTSMEKAVLSISEEPESRLEISETVAPRRAAFWVVV